MTRSIWTRMIGWAVAAPALGLAAAFLVAGTAPPETGPALLSYAVSLTPLAVVIGAAGGRRAGLVRAAGRRSGAAAVTGAVVALLAAIAMAGLLATARFWRDGATGVPTLGTLRYAREMLFVFGLLPGAAVAGAAIAQWFKGGRGLLAAVAVGGVIATVIGPSLIAIAWLGRMGVNPVVLTVIVLGLVAVVGRRVATKERRGAFRRASLATRASLAAELKDLDRLAGEGLDDS